MRTVVISQPTYLPWIGYFRIMQEADVYVFLDNVQFEPRSWQCRNRMKSAAGTTWITVPTHHRMPLKIFEVEIDNTKSWMRQHCNAIKTSYGKATFYKQYRSIIESIYQNDWTMLVDLNIHISRFIANELDIHPLFVQASKINVAGKRTNLLLEICKLFDADRYVSSIAAIDYMPQDGAKEAFDKEGINVQFLEVHPPVYPQLFGEFIPQLSAIDYLLNCGPGKLEIPKEATKYLPLAEKL